MEEILFNSLSKYFNTLEHVGYVQYKKVYNILLLRFIYRFLTYDYKGFINKDDYKHIDRMLDCLFGTCLIPYEDYAMATLNIDNLTELRKELDEVKEKVDKIEVGGIPGSDDKTLLERIIALENEPVVLWTDDYDNP